VHPFDSRKYGKVFDGIVKYGCIGCNDYTKPIKCPRNFLLAVHSPFYLLSLCYSIFISKAVEVPICFLPSWVLRWRVLDPMLYATYGSALAALNACKKGWAINLSGGYHHCSGSGGGGFCVYADISLMVHCVRKWRGIRKVMIVDLDAHQGNGHERDFIGDSDTYIIDFYNAGIYPGDIHAK
jgi:histone deacetylase 11